MLFGLLIASGKIFVKQDYYSSVARTLMAVARPLFQVRTWVSNYIPYFYVSGITCPFPNLNVGLTNIGE